MNAAERKALIRNLKRRGSVVWTMSIPREAGLFYGKRVKLHMRPLVWEKKGEPPLTTFERGLVETILSDLPKLLRKAEIEWLKYERTGGDARDTRYVSTPNISLDREDQAGADRGRWTLVVGFRAPNPEDRNPDYSWHIEFMNKTFIEIWSGD